MVIVVLGILLFIILAIAGWWVGRYNFFAQTKEAIDTQWSNIVTEYERRVDLFLNLAKNVKGYKKHEKETLKEVTAMRQAKFGATKKEQAQNLGQLDKMLSGMNVVFERYPTLKADGLYDRFMEDIRNTEDRINVARTGYNTVVREYESSRVSFPDMIVANTHGFKEVNYWESTRLEQIQVAPEVDV